MKQRREGQSLVEVLLAVAIGTILIVAGVALIVPALQSNTQAAKIQMASSLGKELLDNMRVWSEGNWNKVLALATGTTNTYYLNTTGSPYTPTVVGSVQSIVVSTSTYERYFYLSDVYRDSSGNIVTSGGTYDPSTKQVTVGYNWLGGPATNTMTTYLVRARNNVVTQNDWSGGPNQSGPETSTNNQFATSSNIDYSKTAGSIYVAIPGY
jgi:type II secretory pathway pseudopilin PulG